MLIQGLTDSKGKSLDFFFFFFEENINIAPKINQGTVFVFAYIQESFVFGLLNSR